LSIINEHIISIEFGSNSFNATCDLNTKTCSSKGEVFMNWNVWNEWYNDKKTQGKQQVEQPFVGHKKKHYLTRSKHDWGTTFEP
jgi:hypothetical protein